MPPEPSAEPLDLSATLVPGAPAATGNVTIKLGDDHIPIRVTVPVEPTTLEPLLPIFQGFLGAMVDRAVGQAAAAGLSVSCRAGCGACCRQAVPIAPSEARDVAAHVAAMPDARRTQVQARFAAARQALAAAGIGDRAATFDAATMEDRLAFGMAYFRAGVACPFLEDESCSIHPVRPLACREYLVTSPAENCRWPTMDNVRPVRLGGSLGQALIATEAVMAGHGRLLLVDALDWAAANPAPPPVHNGPSLVKGVFDVLAKLSG
ncbi:YkgJ family cysteine cluster protein [Polymorphobacter fuscus]|uniref:YkgJ family cysteine cluster protein n=1 Tax=Sandarakinorhabdus fusca TaxID=1439888 RepID=A0A7C9KMT4_9SPHN|nr:YkgJ family cysteine cluster protein [Polymorphobacter fuscus]KAB7644811.1 YkgJ family cysteine cluster protein [Polymorphobacter fuscus]MQT18083.1 YkgJ family cysteine cluster protein [Polymorphobacter fuscus]NJC09401.1 Fe-S-cluster containining protein [Polymorphobacter fuscus]